MVPEGWSLKTIGELADVKGGKRLPKGYQLTDENTGFPYIRVTDMFDGGVDVSSIKYVPEEIAPKISRYRIGKDDIFITVAGTLGLIGEVPEELDGANLTENADKLTNLKCNRRFLLEVLRSPIVQKPIDAEKTQNAQPKLALTRIKEFLVPVPPLTEQKKIAQILSTWDQAITATERLLENSQQRKKGLMQQLLTGKKRLPGFEGEWEETRLGDLFAERSEIGVENLPLLSITSEDGVVYQDATGRKDTSNADKSKYKRICPGDIGYNTMRMWQGRSSLSDKDGVVSPAYTILASREDADSLFFSYLFKLPEMIHVFYRHSQGLVSDTWNLKYNHFRKIVWRVPPKAEQSAIAKILLASDFEIDALKLRIDYLKQEKKALMQQLLTGKRRVQVDTEAA